MNRGTGSRPQGEGAAGAVCVESLEKRQLLSTTVGRVPWLAEPIIQSDVVNQVPSDVGAAAASSVKINFQPGSAAAASGYLIDDGKTYVAQSGQTFGWSVDHSANVADRGVNSDQRLDTVVGVQAKARWELAVANGQYTVLVSVGDAATSSRNNVWIEGVNVFNYESLAANAFNSRSVTVNVSDGRLTLGIGSAASNTVKINYIEVAGGVTSPPPTSPPPASPPPPPGSGTNINFQPSAATPVADYLVDAGQTFAARNGQSYGWTIDNVSQTVDRNQVANQLQDTVLSPKASSRWELAVPNGQYSVTVSVGDASASGNNNVWIEGVNLFNYQKTAAGSFAVKSLTVNVSDGRLTLGLGSAGTGTVKLNYIEVAGATQSPPPTSPPPVSPPPPTSPPPTSPPPSSPPPAVPPPPPSSLGVAAPLVSAAAAGTTSLAVNWNAPDSSDAGKISGYQVRYIVGAYAPGAAGQAQIVNVPAGQTGAMLTGLMPFEMYSIEVRAIDTAGGSSGAGKAAVFTQAPANQQRYLYVFRLPKNKTGFPNLKPQIEVYDINNNHAWVKNIPLPTGIYNVRGVAANVPTGRIFLTYFNSPSGGSQSGGMLCLDINTGAVIWKRNFTHDEAPAPDRFDISPDGSKIYLPSTEEGDERYWSIVNPSNGTVTGRIYHTSSPHNTIFSIDGTRAFLEGQEKGTQPADVKHTIGVVDTATNQVIQKIGPFVNVIRPFTVNGKASLVYAVVNNFVGIQVGDAATGKILYTTPPANYTQPSPSNINHTHGILLTPNETEVWMVDTRLIGIHVFDVSNVPAGPPKYVTFIKTRKFGQDINGNTTSAASQDTTSTPSWMNRSHDGKYVYAEGGEIIDAQTKKVVGQLRAKKPDGTLAPYTHSRFMLEIDFVNGQAVRATDQFGVGLVR